MRRVIGLTILLVCLSFQVIATSAKIYVWRNEQGVLVFSDTPRPGAEEVKVKPQNSFSSSIDTSILDITPQKIVDDFQVIINQPEDKSSIRDNTGSVYIAGRVQPVFKAGLKIQLYLDGKKYKKPQSKAIYILRNVDRGEHQIKMVLLNNKGKEIASSKTITFYLFRISINKPR
jgi:uncharacterized protein DUF4124